MDDVLSELTFAENRAAKMDIDDLLKYAGPLMVWAAIDFFDIGCSPHSTRLEYISHSGAFTSESSRTTPVGCSMFFTLSRGQATGTWFTSHLVLSLCLRRSGDDRIVMPSYRLGRWAYIILRGHLNESDRRIDTKINIIEAVRVCNNSLVSKCSCSCFWGIPLKSQQAHTYGPPGAAASGTPQIDLHATFPGCPYFTLRKRHVNV